MTPSKCFPRSLSDLVTKDDMGLLDEMMSTALMQPNTFLCYFFFLRSSFWPLFKIHVLVSSSSSCKRSILRLLPLPLKLQLFLLFLLHHLRLPLLLFSPFSLLILFITLLLFPFSPILHLLNLPLLLLFSPLYRLANFIFLFISSKPCSAIQLRKLVR